MDFYNRMTKEERLEHNRKYHQKWYYSKTPEERSALAKKKRDARKARYGKDYNAYPEWRAKAWPKPLCQSHMGSIRKKYPLALVEDFILEDFIVWYKNNYHKECHYCGQSSEHVDHIVPLSRGGLHVPANLQMLCATCNTGKNDLMPEQWEQWIKHLISHQTR